MIKILFLYSRDIHPTDAGGSRTTIQLINFLAGKDDMECYCAFHIEEHAHPNIIEIPLYGINPENIKAIVNKEGIHLIIVPEGELLTGIVRKAIAGTSCKIISAMHNKPGYERIGLFKSVINRMLHGGNVLTRIKGFIAFTGYPLYHRWYVKKRSIGFREAYFHSDRLVLLSSSFISQYKKVYKLPDVQKIVAIGNALSFDDFATPTDIRNKENVLLVVSRFDEISKRLSLIIKTWSLLEKYNPSWKLRIVGYGKDEQLYRNMVNKLGLKQVFFEGRQSPENFYKESSVFLMTSAYEGWGMTITEAQQMGCIPVVMDTFSTVYDLIEDGKNGFICPDKDLTYYAAKIQWLIDHAEERHKMAEYTVNTTSRFSKEVIGNKWISLIKEVLSE